MSEASTIISQAQSESLGFTPRLEAATQHYERGIFTAGKAQFQFLAEPHVDLDSETTKDPRKSETENRFGRFTLLTIVSEIMMHNYK